MIADLHAYLEAARLMSTHGSWLLIPGVVAMWLGRERRKN